jgi:formate hydrogenlyase subunit 3/multisubunit Na+/H+ antiporter MnhD subunit
LIDVYQAALLGTVTAPFLGALIVLGLRSHPNAREASSFIVGVITFLMAIANLPAVFSGRTITLTLAVMSSHPELRLELWADGLGLLFASLASFLWIITTVYSTGYMRGLNEHSQTRYYACFALVIGATMGVSLAQNLLTLFVFYEILTIATYPLVVHHETEEAFQAGRKYLIYTIGGGTAVLVGTLALLAAGGDAAITFVPGGNLATGSISLEIARVAFVLLFLGFGVKAALVPEHGWLPSAMIAPTPVSGLLHAVAVVKAGVFGLLRVMLFVFGPMLMATLGMQNLVIGVAVITILIGSLFALTRDNFKLRLAYSTISQLSYIVLAAALLTPIGFGTPDGRSAAVIGAVFLIAAHAFGKLTMFFVAGAIAVETGKTKVSELDGIGRRMPGTMIAFFLATLSMVGLPPMAGFVGKWFLSIDAWNAGYWWVLLVLVFSSVLNLAYFLPIVIRAFLRPYDGAPGEARWFLRGPLFVTAIGTLILGVWTTLPYGPLEIASTIASQVTGRGLAVLAPFTAGLAIPPFIFFLVGGPLVIWLFKGRVRQAGLVILAALALIDTLYLPYTTGWSLPFMGYKLVLLKVDSLSYLMGVIFAIITFLAVLYAVSFSKPWMHLVAILYAGTSLGVVFAGDWLTLLVFWELAGITSTLLIWEAGGEAVQAGYRYLLFHVFGGAMLAAGIAMLFFEGSGSAVGAVTGFWSSIFIIIGIGVNLAMIPLHTWLPDSYPRAHLAASVFLSVYTTKAAVYLLARAQPSTYSLAFMGAIMAVYGVSFAVFQNNMRKLLSYHIVSQVGFMVAGVGLANWPHIATQISELSLDGGMAHVFNHILYKALLFMTVGVIIWRTGENNLERLGGLMKKMPVTTLAFWIAALSISGVPLFNGFVSKGMILSAAEETNTLLWVLLEIASFGTFLSFLKLGYFAFIRHGTVEASDPPFTMKVAMLGAAVLCVAIGVYPPLLYAILPFGGSGYQAYDLTRVLQTSLVLGAAAVTFFTLGRKYLAPHETRLRDFDVGYVAMGHAVVVFANILLNAFGTIYRAITGRIMPAVTRFVGRMQTGLLGVNGLVMVVALLILLILIAIGVI